MTAFVSVTLIDDRCQSSKFCMLLFSPVQDELEQSINELREEMGAEASPSPSAASRPRAEETKEEAD
ncbi:hypothetical protein V2J09_015857 [Rumex salicifolius]